MQAVEEEPGVGRDGTVDEEEEEEEKACPCFPSWWCDRVRASVFALCLLCVFCGRHKQQQLKSDDKHKSSGSSSFEIREESAATEEAGGGQT